MSQKTCYRLSPLSAVNLKSMILKGPDNLYFSLWSSSDAFLIFFFESPLFNRNFKYLVNSHVMACFLTDTVHRALYLNPRQPILYNRRVPVSMEIHSIMITLATWMDHRTVGYLTIFSPLSTNFLFSKVCWQHPGMNSLYSSSKLSCQ